MTKDNTDLKYAEKVLEEDHYGLEQVKERVLEYLAVRIPHKERFQSDSLSGRASPEQERHPLPAPLPERWERSMSGLVWAEFTTRLKSGDTENVCRSHAWPDCGGD